MTVHNNEGTVHFLEMIVRFWIIVNCKNPFDSLACLQLIHLKRCSRKLRQGVGETYFINVRQVLEKLINVRQVLEKHQLTNSIKQLSCLNLIRFFSKWRQNWAISAIFAAST